MKNNKKIKNVFLGHTLEEYKAIYDIDKTIHIDKATVDEFNKSHKEDPKDSPLEGRLWWLIGDTYYEVNSINHKEEYKYNKKNKGPGFKIAMASILGGLGIAGVGTGTFYVIKSTGMKDPITDREIEITGNEKNNVTFAKQVSSDGIQVKLTCKDETKEVNKVEISIGNKTLNENEYSFDLSTSTISIKKTVLKENEGNIGINPTLSKKIIHVTGVRIKDSLNKKLGDTISIDELQINVLPENADNKNYTLSTTTPSIVQITGTTIKCIAQGNGNIKVTTEDGGFFATCNVAVTEKVFNITFNYDNDNVDIDYSKELKFSATLDGENVNATWEITNGSDAASINSSTGVLTLADPNITKGGTVLIKGSYTDPASSKTYTTANPYKISLGSFNKINTKSDASFAYISPKGTTSEISGRLVIPEECFDSEKLWGWKYIKNFEDNGTYTGKGFDGYTGLTEVIFPLHFGGHSETYEMWDIRKNAFKNCNNLTKVHFITSTLPSAIEVIGESAFECSNNDGQLAEINLEDLNSLQTIKSSAFEGQSELAEITIPSGVKTVEPDAFKNCSSLATVTINSSFFPKNGNYDTNCKLVDNATTLKITKTNVNLDEITTITNGFTSSTPTDDYWVFTKGS